MGEARIKKVYKGLLAFCSAFCILHSAFFCGYRAPGKQVNLPPEIRKIAVVTFENDTTEAGVEEVFTEAIISEIAKDKRLDISTVSEADAVLTGRILKIKLMPISFDTDGFVTGYKVTVEASLTLTKDGKVIWASGKLTDGEEFNVAGNLLSNEVFRTRAIAEVAEDLMEDAHDSMLEMF